MSIDLNTNLDVNAAEAEWLEQAGTLDASIANMDDLLKQVKAERDDLYRERIEAHGEFTVGTKRRYMGYETKTTCIDVGRAIDAVLTATEGDLVAMSLCLSSGALKPGACRQVLGDQFNSHFLTERKGTVKVVKVADTRFMPDQKGGAA